MDKICLSRMLMSITKDAAWTTCLNTISNWMQYILEDLILLWIMHAYHSVILHSMYTDMRSSSGSASRNRYHCERKLGTPLFGGISASNPLSTSSNSSVNQFETRLWHHVHKLSSTMQAIMIKVICKHQHMDHGIVTSIYSARLPKAWWRWRRSAKQRSVHWAVNPSAKIKDAVMPRLWCSTLSGVMDVCLGCFYNCPLLI